MTVADIISQTQHKMGRTIETLREDFTKIRTGRASTGLLEHIMVDYYGCPTPLTQVAQLGVGDARTLTVQPWEKNMVAVVEKAIRNSDLGLNPATSGMVIRVPLPPPTPTSTVSARTRKSARTISAAPKPKSRRSPTASSAKSTRSLPRRTRKS